MVINACTLMTNWAEKQLKQKLKNSHTYLVIRINLYQFIIKNDDLDGHVDVFQKTCNCYEFQINQLSCEYMVTVCKYIRNYFVYDLCYHYYSINAWVIVYTESIYPVDSQEE